MKKLFVTLLTFVILTIYHYEVVGTGSFRRSVLKKTEIKEKFVRWGDHGLFFHEGWTDKWHTFIPYCQIVGIDKEGE